MEYLLNGWSTRFSADRSSEEFREYTARRHALRECTLRMLHEAFWNSISTVLSDSTVVIVLAKFETNLKMYVDVPRDI